MKVLFPLQPFALRVLCGILLAAGAVTAAEDEVEQLRLSFEKRYEAVNTQRDEQLAKLETGYLAALNRHLEKVKSSGKLEDVLSIRDEVEAVKKGKDPLPALPATATYDFKQLRKTYTDARAAIQKSHFSSVSDLAAKMTEALKAKEVQFTKAGKIDDALAAQKLRESLDQDEGIVAAREQVSKQGPLKKDWVSLLESDWEIEQSESWYVGDAEGLKGKGRYLEESKALMQKVRDGGFPHFIGVPKARVVFKLKTKVTRFEAKVAMLSFGNASLILRAGDKEVTEVRIDNIENKEEVLKAEFAPTNRLILDFDAQGDSSGDWIGIFSPKVR